MNPVPDNRGNSQDKILYQIKRLGPQTARELGEHLGVTTMGIRQHLAQLEEKQVIRAMTEESVGRGRPARRWKLTEKGHSRFPDAHAQVTSDLIISIREILGESAIDKIIAKRTADMFENYQRQLGKIESLQGKLNLLCELRTQEGYMAELECDGSGFLLMEHHCPICVAARSCQGFCSSELEVFQTLLRGIANVNREDHIMSGARRCSYRITPV